jgi:hypothetical protein
MHHFIYPSQDTFITDALGYEDLNFGLDEILQVGTNNVIEKLSFPSTSYQIPLGTFVTNYCLTNFSGSISTSSFYGSAANSWGRIFDTSVDPVAFSVAYFSGSFVGSVVGWQYGNYYSSSNATGSFSAFSGTIVVHSIVTSSTWEGLLLDYTNWQTTWESVLSGSGVIDGWVSGSLSGSFIGLYNGSLNGFTGKILVGNIDGDVWRYVPHTEIVSFSIVNRALVQFDITKISESVASGDIVNPHFQLKLNVAKEFELPITYKIYAFPISEGWVMGDGYVSDNGSTQGASWLYRDSKNGTPWAVPGASYVSSFTSTQSFNYQVGDINLDVTPMVNAWISGTFANNGILLVSSDEFSPTGSGMGLYFFSKDTNTIYEPVLDVGWNSGSGGWSWSTGSITTSSIITASIGPGIAGTIWDGSSINGSLYGGFTGFAGVTVSSSFSESFFVNYSGSTTESVFTQSYTQSYASGFMMATGVNGLIISMSIYGNFSGSIYSFIAPVYSKCNSCIPNFYATTGDYFYPQHYPSTGDGGAFFASIDGNFPSLYAGNPNIPSFIQAGLAYMNQPTTLGNLDVYGWNHTFNTFNQYDWTSDHVYQQEFFYPQYHGCGPFPLTSSYGCHLCGVTLQTQSILMGTLFDGNFSGSTFTSSLINGYILGYGNLFGTWNSGLINGTIISASYPFYPAYPSFINVSFYGPHVYGPAFGQLSQITTSSISSSYYDMAVFDGVFTGGTFAGIHIHAPFTGSILTASYFYTGSIILASTSLSPITASRPFTTVIQNIPSSVKAGDIIKVNVFARPEFPLKNFNRQTQFNQYLIPQYLPTSSYYAIKDNETEEIILSYDENTKLSCDSNGNYFLLDTTGFPQERYFKILIRVEQSGSIYTIDHNNIFKIVR